MIFRDEETLLANSGMDYTEAYKTLVTPYKGALEVWYLHHRSCFTDGLIIFLTAWVIVFPKSDLTYKFFKDLPAKPEWMEK